jgi:superfamily II DNA/RNA helicase
VTTSGAEAGMDEVIDNVDTLSSEISLTDVDLQADALQAEADDGAPAGFGGLGLSESILRAVTDSGYTRPTPIQARTIPLVLERRDVIGIAQTGTGKTASFTLPMIEMLAKGRAKARMPRALVLEPTRELADQVAESFDKHSKYSKLTHALLIGGVSMDEQVKKLDRGVDVLIATPGRLLDHFGRGRLLLSQVNILVIDEADRMLDMGFIPDVEDICKKLPFTRQTLFYSATMPPEIKRLVDHFLSNPACIEVARPATTASNIAQVAVETPANDWAKREALRRLIRENGDTLQNAIVFCNRKRDVDVVAKSLVKHGFDAAPIHGDLEQSLRMKTLDRFRSGELKFLVASDVAARGLDVPSVSHVFNFEVPIHADDYVHRVGRTGRAGRSGQAYMLMTPRDAKYVEMIEKLTGKPLERRAMMDIEVRPNTRPRQGEGRRGAHGGRDRGRQRSSHQPPDGKYHDQIAPIEPASAHNDSADATPDKTQSQTENRKSARPRRQPRQKEASVSESHGMDRTDRKERHERDSRAAVPEAVDHSQLPAFLLRPVPVKKREPQSD